MATLVIGTLVHYRFCNSLFYLFFNFLLTDLMIEKVSKYGGVFSFAVYAAGC